MAHDRYVNSIQEAVDGTLGSIRRAELEMHLLECDECRALYGDLQRIHDAAAELPSMPAPDRTWLQVAGRLRQEGRIREIAPPRAARKPVNWTWLAAAAALVIAVGGSLLLLRRSPAPAPAPVAQTASAPQPAGNAAAVKSVESVQNEVDAAQQQF